MPKRKKHETGKTRSQKCPNPNCSHEAHEPGQCKGERGYACNCYEEKLPDGIRDGIRKIGNRVLVVSKGRITGEQG